MIRTKVFSGEIPCCLENALNDFLNDVGWGSVLHISYSQGDIGAHSRYSALVVYKI